jgi:O-antigen ligase
MKGFIIPVKHLSYKTFFLIGVAIYVYRNKYRLDIVFSKLLPLGTCLSFLLMAVVYFTQGISFFMTDALRVENSTVTLITMSYNFVFYAVLSIYMIKEKEQSDNKTIAWICFITCAISILFMGKRGAVLSIVGTLIYLYLVANKTWQKSFLYSSVIVLLYIVTVNNIDYVFNFMSIFSQRLANYSRMAYYFGDTNGRDLMWDAAIEQIRHGPWLGYYPKLLFVDKMSFAWGMHPHNIFLESLMTMGIVGSIPFFLLLIHTFLLKVYHFVVIDGAYRFFGLLFVSELIHNCFSGTLYASWFWPILFVFSLVSTTDKWVGVKKCHSNI